MKKMMLSLATACVAVLYAATTTATAAKPFVIPELREWKEAKGQFVVSNATPIVVDKANEAELRPVAEAFAADVREMFGLELKVSTSVKAGQKTDGAIRFSIAKIATKNAEGYELQSSVKGIDIRANEKVGAYWATRSVLQIMEQSAERAVPAGTAVDYPDYPMRGFMLDAGRKYFKIEFLEDYVKFMSYYKMNLFQIHLNDNSFKQFYNNSWDQTQAAFRLESETFPGLASKEGHYTKAEFRDLQILAESKFVTIVPEIDAPAHTLAFSHYMPELGSKDYGADHLDLFNPKTYEFMDALWKEYIGGDDPVFRGEYVHIGTDEYSNKDQKVVEKFRYFTDHYIKHVESFGKKAALWGALTHAQGETPVKVDDVLMWCWYNGYAEPDSMMRLGYDVLSVPDGLLYIVPLAGYYYDYLNTKHLYEKWTPAHIGKAVFEEQNPQIQGGVFAVWNDHAGNGVSSRDVHHRVWPAMQTLAVKMWDGVNVTLPYDEFNAKRELLSEAPGVNLLGRMPLDKNFEVAVLKPNQTLPLNEVGYGYRVSFNVLCEEELSPATVLAYNNDAVFYLADPLRGEVGFSRDGYLFSFNYRLPVGVKVSLAIESTNTETRLYVDGKLRETLDITYISVGKENGQNSRRALIKTLQFPLAAVGHLGSAQVTDIKVEKM